MQSFQMINQFSFEIWHFSIISRRANPAGVLINYVTYILKGRCHIVTKNKTLYTKEGDVFFIPKDLPYEILWEGNPDTGEIKFLSYGFFHLHFSVNF